MGGNVAIVLPEAVQAVETELNGVRTRPSHPRCCLPFLHLMGCFVDTKPISQIDQRVTNRAVPFSQAVGLIL